MLGVGLIQLADRKKYLESTLLLDSLWIKVGAEII